MGASRGTLCPSRVSLTGTGPDLRTVEIDSIRGMMIPEFQHPVASQPMLQQRKVAGDTMPDTDERGTMATHSSFSEVFVWGAATAGHQVEGNNVNSDVGLLEHLAGTIFAKPSGDACDH